MRSSARLGTALALAGAIAVGAGACGGSNGSADPPWRLVAAAPGKTTDAGTAKFSITAATNVLGQSVNFSGDGVFNFTKKTGHLSFALPAALGGQTLDEIVTPEKLYLKIPSLTAGKYAAIDLSDITGGSNPLSQLGNSDPTTALETLKGVSHDVRKVGSATIRGANTTHYSGTIDVSAATQNAPTELRAKIQETFGQLKSLPFDAYLDDQGRLNRFVQHVTLPASDTTGGKPVTVDSTFDLYDFGTPADTSAPPASQTVDGSSLLQQLLQRS
jgi:hypothetical protein